MGDDEWENEWSRTMAVMLAGEALGEVNQEGDLLRDDTMLLLFNAHTEKVDFKLPGGADTPWDVVVDTTGARTEPGRTHAPGSSLTLPDRTLMLLRRPRSEQNDSA